jgi:hypothetical protein
MHFFRNSPSHSPGNRRYNPALSKFEFDDRRHILVSARPGGENNTVAFFRVLIGNPHTVARTG